MKKHIYFLLQMFIFWAITLMSVACNSEDDLFEEAGNIKPDTEMSDPEGTIKLSMMSGNKDNATMLNGLFYIGNDNNFSGIGSCSFVSFGAVNGLGDITNIPTTGWANQVAVEPGNGYVACNYSRNYNGVYSTSFYRIYVSDYIRDSTGNVLGANVKYQKPFWGNDEAISTELNSLTFPSEGGTQTLVFNNTGIISFNAKTDIPEWCSIKSISTLDQPFLTNGIAITANGNPSANAITGKITLTTLYGKETVIDIAISGKEPYINISVNEKEVSAAEHWETFNIQSNIPFENLIVNSPDNWCKAELVNNQATINSNNKQIKFIGQQPVSETRANINDGTATSYALILTLDENNSTQSRETYVTVSSADKKTSSTIKIIQSGIIFEVKNDKIGFDKNSNYRTITINTTVKEWEAQSSEKWCTYSKNGNQITIRVSESTEDRTAIVTFKGFDTKIEVHQSKYAVGDFYSENGLEGTVGYIGDVSRYIYMNVGEAYWSTEYVLTGANSMTDGEYNMNVIKRIDFWQDSYPAFLLCEQLNTNGITGWYLPSAKELEYINRKGWSSTEYSEDQSYYNGSRRAIKNYDHTVYAVHKF